MSTVIMDLTVLKPTPLGLRLGEKRLRTTLTREAVGMRTLGGNCSSRRRMLEVEAEPGVEDTPPGLPLATPPITGLDRGAGACTPAAPLPPPPPSRSSKSSKPYLLVPFVATPPVVEVEGREDGMSLRPPFDPAMLPLPVLGSRRARFKGGCCRADAGRAPLTRVLGLSTTPRGFLLTSSSSPSSSSELSSASGSGAASYTSLPAGVRLSTTFLTMGVLCDT
mmetsp:Transcript_15495/g.41978  ORF Transcript_15495/g.41978 Transcript_15495/m.41978 type:complete len:222 (-) Transcript_15495:2557-3222(-)